VYEPDITAPYRSKISDLWFSLHACNVTFYMMQCNIWVVQVELPLRSINPLNAKLNPIFHLLALLGAHHILHVSRVRVNHHVIKTWRRLELQIRSFVAQETDGGAPTAYTYIISFVKSDHTQVHRLDHARYEMSFHSPLSHLAFLSALFFFFFFFFFFFKFFFFFLFYLHALAQGEFFVCFVELHF